MQQTVGGNTTNYTLDLNGGLTQVLADGTNTYLYGIGRIGEYSQPLLLDEWQYHLPDALSSVRQFADASGAVSYAQSYKPYGESLGAFGGQTSSYGFAGEWTDATGLQYLRARYYAPEVGRFIARDPWAGNDWSPQSQNRWTYVESNPINRTDPTGKYFWGLGQTFFESSSFRDQYQNIHIRIQELLMGERGDSRIHAEFPGSLFIPVPHVDLLDSITGEVWEIKPYDDSTSAFWELTIRIIALNGAQHRELLTGFTRAATRFDWNSSPPYWIAGSSFYKEVYIGTDDTGKWDIYAGQVSPGIILWWKSKNLTPKMVPVPILLPEKMRNSERNQRPLWEPSFVPSPAYAFKPYFPDLAQSAGLAGLLTVCVYIGIKAIEATTCGPCALALP